jgi:hypothetical protein
MNKDELFQNVRSLLRKAIASRLDIAKADYDGSLENQNAVNIFLTDVMSIAYNGTDMDAALEELCTLHYYGEENEPEVINFVRKKIVFVQNKFGAEIAAFAKMHEMNQADTAPETTWAQIQTMVVLGEDYITNEQ